MKRLASALFAFAALQFHTASAQGGDILDAARAGDTAKLEAYVEAGGDIEITNRMGHTLFVLAAYNGHTETAARLIELGSAPCTLDSMGSHALMGVVFQGHEQTFDWLLENTACDVNHQNYAGQTALMLAALFDRTEFATRLIAEGADPALRDHQGNTPASLAAAQGSTGMVDLLTESQVSTPKSKQEPRY